MPVARRIGLEIDVFCTACEDAIFASHWATLTLLLALTLFIGFSLYAQ
jgi:hypothetical protein